MPTEPAPIDPAGGPLPMQAISVVSGGPGRVTAVYDPAAVVSVPAGCRTTAVYRVPAPPAPDPSPDDVPPDEPHVVG